MQKDYGSPFKWWIYTIVALSQVMLNFDFTAVNLALAPISNHFYVSMMTVQWVNNAYIITCAALMIATSRLSEIYGKRLFFISGILLFTLASVLTGSAPHISWLIGSRILQGIGFATLFPVSLALVFDAFPEHQKGFAIASTVAVGGICQALGPSLGGFIIHFLSWRWIFFINLPIGFICTAIAIFTCPKDTPLISEHKTDLIGIIALALSIILIMLVFNEQITSSVLKGFSVLLGFIIFSFLMKRELKIKNPIIDITLFRNRNFSLYSATRALYGYGFFSILFILGLYLINIVGYNAIKAGLIILCMSSLYGFLAPIMGKWIDRSSLKYNIIFGLFLAFIGFLTLPFIGVPKNWHDLLVPLVISGIATTFILPTNATAALKSVEPTKTSTASGLYYTLSVFTGALGIAITAWLIHIISLYSLKKYLLVNHVVMTTKQFDFLTHVANGTASIQHMHLYFNHLLTVKLIPIAQQSFLNGFRAALWFCGFLCLIAIVLCFKTTESK